MGTSGGPDLVQDGLVLCLDAADKNSYPGSGTTWTDLSANGHVGTLTNGPTFDSNNGGAIDFDGNNDYVTFPDSSTFDVLALDFTIEIVLKSQGAISAHESPLSRYNPTGEPGIYMYVNQTSGYPYVRFNDGTNAEITPHISVDIRNDNTWHHLCWSFDRSGNCLTYHNGSFSTSTDISSRNASCNIAKPMIIGANSSTGQVWDGQISIVRQYVGLALSAAEVSQNFNAQRSRFGV